MGKTIQETVAEKIAGSGPDVLNIVVDKLAEIEISKRVEAITKSISKQDQLEKELKKIDAKNDVITYVEGKEVQSMSKTRFEEIKKAKEKLDGLTKAMDTALSSNTAEAYTKLNETLNKLNNAGGDKKESPGESKSES
jgi:biopolymer transport protein ExbB/TolQ